MPLWKLWQKRDWLNEDCQVPEEALNPDLVGSRILSGSPHAVRRHCKACPENGDFDLLTIQGCIYIDQQMGVSHAMQATP